MNCCIFVTVIINLLPKQFAITNEGFVACCCIILEGVDRRVVQRRYRILIHTYNNALVLV